MEKSEMRHTFSQATCYIIFLIEWWSKCRGYRRKVGIVAVNTETQYSTSKHFFTENQGYYVDQSPWRCPFIGNVLERGKLWSKKFSQAGYGCHLSQSIHLKVVKNHSQIWEVWSKMRATMDYTTDAWSSKKESSPHCGKRLRRCS